MESGKSILIMGRPGIGKTTMLREAARVLADDLGKRVVVVDTSNEIAGDGDIPHPAIGKARRMQVRTPSLQHEVMIEAVENHMPQVIVIDEIGTELEAVAARTIAERGVQLIGTAHGNNLDNLMLNPTLSDLIGGIQSVTLGDEEARRRRTQKSVLEREGAADVRRDRGDPGSRAGHGPCRRRRRRSTRCCAATPSRRSCAGRTRAASTGPSRGRARRRASSWAASDSPGSSARAAVAGGRSRAGAARRSYRGATWEGDRGARPARPRFAPVRAAAGASPRGGRSAGRGRTAAPCGRRAGRRRAPTRADDAR